MAEFKLWWLSLPEHANIPDGVVITRNHEEEADRMWAEYGSKAEEMKVGLHDLTPPTLKDVIVAHLLVHDNFHGMHKIDDTDGRVRLLRESTLQYMSSPGSIPVVRLPEDTYEHNAAFKMGDAAPRLYYILRWLQLPDQPIARSQRELVSVGVR